MVYEALDIILLFVIVGFEVAYWRRDKRKERDDKEVSDQQLLVLNQIHSVLTAQKEVLEDSQAELADMRDEMVEEPNESNQDRNDPGSQDS